MRHATRFISSLTAVLMLSGCPEGDTGDSGVAGADGSLRTYGDGSAGNKTVSANETLADTNLQYNNFIVEAGFTLTVESGTVIRCLGTFTNNGTIDVLRGGPPGITNRPERGVSRVVATYDNGSTRGEGLTAFQARQLRYPGVIAGGTGGTTGNSAARGGGSIVVLARGALSNTGTIQANGDSADTNSFGGAGGGVIILASATSISNTGTIQANGGNGEASSPSNAGGGGGGGGIVHLLAPTISGAGTMTVAFGVGGAGAAAAIGGGGGACGGNGGNSGLGGGGSGVAGHSLQSLVDPTGLF